MNTHKFIILFIELDDIRIIKLILILIRIKCIIRIQLVYSISFLIIHFLYFQTKHMFIKQKILQDTLLYLPIGYFY